MSCVEYLEVVGTGQRLVLDRSGRGTLLSFPAEIRKKRRTNRRKFEQRVLADYDVLEKRVWLPKTEAIMLELGRLMSERMGSRSRRAKRQLETRRVGDFLPVDDQMVNELFDQLYDKDWLGELVAWLELQFEGPIEATIDSAVLATSAAMGLSFSLGPSRQVKQSLMARANQLAGGVADTTYDMVKRSMRRGLEEGLSIPGIADLVQQSMMGTSRSRAVRIARTEVVSSYNAAVHAAGDRAGVITGYEWLSTSDSRTRRTHAAAGGQRVRPGGLFQVGAAQLQYPGDPSGPGKEVINCRCVMLPLTEDEWPLEKPEESVVEQPAPYDTTTKEGSDRYFKEYLKPQKTGAASPDESAALFYRGGMSDDINWVARGIDHPSGHRPWAQEGLTNSAKVNQAFTQLTGEVVHADSTGRVLTNSLVTRRQMGERMVEVLDQIAARTETQHDLTMFRGVNRKFNLAPGDVFSDSGFASHTLLENVANRFAKKGTIFRTRTRAGQNVVPIGGKWEAEVILPRNTQMRVIEVTERGGVTYVDIEPVR